MLLQKLIGQVNQSRSSTRTDCNTAYNVLPHAVPFKLKATVTYSDSWALVYNMGSPGDVTEALQLLGCN